MRTLYRRIKYGIFDITTLPMKGKRKLNEHQERRENKRSKEISLKEKKTTLYLKMSLVTLLENH